MVKFSFMKEKKEILKSSPGRALPTIKCLCYTNLVLIINRFSRNWRSGSCSLAGWCTFCQWLGVNGVRYLWGLKFLASFLHSRHPRTPLRWALRFGSHRCRRSVILRGYLCWFTEFDCGAVVWLRVRLFKIHSVITPFWIFDPNNSSITVEFLTIFNTPESPLRTHVVNNMLITR